MACKSCGQTNWKPTAPQEYTSIKMFSTGNLTIYGPESQINLTVKDCIALRRPEGYVPDHIENKRIRSFKIENDKFYFTNTDNQTLYVPKSIMEIVWKTLFDPNFGNNTKILKRKISG